MPTVPHVKTRVPGSTSNLGPGFDCLGVALELYDTLAVERLHESPEIVVESEQTDAMPLLMEVAAAFCEACPQVPGAAYRVALECDVPRSRGLGSSAALRVGLLAALNALSSEPLERFEIARIATRLEGHPDNAVAAVFGGLCVSRTDAINGELVDTQRFPLDRALRFVTASPELEFETQASRARLPSTLSLRDAARNINSVAYLVAVLAAGRFDKLAGAIEDHLHEPSRLPLLPGARQAIDAGIAAGASTGFLSGSGSSVICLHASPELEVNIGDAMREAFESAGTRSQVRALSADNAGFQVLA